MAIEARDKVNKEANARRMFAHAIFTPGWDGWLEHLEGSLARKPESIKGYTVGDNTNKDEAKHPWRMDDEKLTYKGYELAVKYGIKNICVHKGLFPEATARALAASARLRRRPRRRQGGEGLAAAQLRHLSRRLSPRRRRLAPTPAGRSSSRPDASPGSAISPRSRKNSASPMSTPTSASCSPRAWSHEPRLGAALMGIMGKGMGYDRVVWGTDAVWTGSPQWQIEALRRLEIPEDMQKQHGFKPLGAADGPVKTMIFGGTNAKLYNFDLNKRTDIGPNRDRFALMKDEYERNGPARSNLRYGYVRGPVDWEAFA